MIRRLAARLAGWLAAYAGDNDQGLHHSRDHAQPTHTPVPAGVHGVPCGRYAHRYRTAVNR